MNPSERIKAALSRPEATQRPSPVLEPRAEVETTLPLLGEATRVASGRAPATTSVKVENAAPAADPKIRVARRIYLGLTALALMSVTIVVIRERFFAPKPPVPPPNLQVEVRPEGNGLVSIRWNPQSTPIVQAREGRLVVLEANQQPKVIQLQADELKIGHVYYQSSAERLEFRLEAVSATGKVARESVLALSSGTATAAVKPGPFQAPQAEGPASKPAVPTDPKADRPPAASAVTTPPAATTAVVQQPSLPAPPRAFTPPPTPNRQPIEEARAVVLDPSSNLPGPISAPAHVNLPQLNVVPPPAAKAPASRPAPDDRQVIHGGMVQPATLVKKVSPVYPPLARASRIQGIVRFSATVDKTGKLQNIQLMSGPQMLVDAATDAVKKWVYRPMILNGQPTEVITQIEVRFSISE